MSRDRDHYRGRATNPLHPKSSVHHGAFTVSLLHMHRAPWGQCDECSQTGWRGSFQLVCRNAVVKAHTDSRLLCLPLIQWLSHPRYPTMHSSKYWSQWLRASLCSKMKLTCGTGRRRVMGHEREGKQTVSEGTSTLKPNLHIQCVYTLAILSPVCIHNSPAGRKHCQHPVRQIGHVRGSFRFVFVWKDNARTSVKGNKPIKSLCQHFVKFGLNAGF